jgi:hypothetical protein
MEKQAHIPESSVDRLARFFPDAMPVRIPIRVVNSSRADWNESTVIEFGTPAEVLFASTLPLEFGDRVRVENANGSLSAELSIVAVQYEEGRTAVAGRFVGEISNWIFKR